MTAIVLAGWTIAFVFAGGIAIGSLVLLLIHPLTGGRWGHAIAPVARPAAATVPLLFLAALPLAIGSSALFPWVADSHAADADVARLYLNLPAFAIRGVIALAGWSVLAVVAISRRLSPLVAALGLVFHTLMVVLTAVDWILSFDPHFNSTAFGAEIAVQQIAAALACVALLAPLAREQDRGDVGALLLAAILGVAYIAFMSLIVDWYGNLPPSATWYLQHSAHGWRWLAVAAVLAGFVLPLFGLMIAPLRHNRAALRLIGALVLIGIFCHDAWLIAPRFGGWAAALGLAISFCLVAGAAFATRHAAARLFALRETAHGA